MMSSPKEFIELLKKEGANFDQSEKDVVKQFLAQLSTQNTPIQCHDYMELKKACVKNEKVLALIVGRFTGLSEQVVSWENAKQKGVDRLPERHLGSSNLAISGSSYLFGLSSEERSARDTARSTTGKIDSSSGSVPDLSMSSLSEQVSYTGIRNLGNTCYLSAVLQALFCLKGFSIDMLGEFWSTIAQQASVVPTPTSLSSSTSSLSSFQASIGHSTLPLYPTQWSLLAQVAKMTMENATNGHGVLDPNDLKCALDARTNLFQGRTQQDASEFLTYLLDGLNGEMFVQIIRLLKDDLGVTSTSSSTSSLLMMDTDIPEVLLKSEEADSAFVTNKKQRLDVEDPNTNSGVIDLTSDDYNIITPFAGSEYKGQTDLFHTELAVQSTFPLKLAAFVPIIRHFHAEVECTFTCKGCGFIREPITEIFRVFSLNLGEDDLPADSGTGTHPKQYRLSDLLQSNFSKEDLELACTRCCAIGAQATASRIMTSTPSVLVVHIKRSRFLHDTLSYDKIRVPVQFPPSFRLDQEGFRELVHPDATHGGDGDCDKYPNLGGSFADTAQLIRQANASSATDVRQAMDCEVVGNGRNVETTELTAAMVLDNNITDSTDVEDSMIIEDGSDYRGQKNDHFSSSAVESGDGQVPEGGTDRVTASRQYRLKAVVRHFGNDSVFSGHYITDIYADGTWQRCDDSVVSSITEQTVLADQTSPYILFYERQIS